MLKLLRAGLPLAALLFLSVAGYGGEPKTDAPRPEADPVKLSGRGDCATKAFPLADGLTTWTVSHEGRSNFKVHLIDDQGDEAALWVNEIGRHSGTRAGNVRKAGKYRLQVEADGGWSVTVAQPKPPRASTESPQAFSGKGSSVSTFFSLRPGAHVIESAHKGKGVFRVKVLDARGVLVHEPAAFIGVYDGSKSVKIEEPGVYLVSVYADGDWTVSVD